MMRLLALVLVFPLMAAWAGEREVAVLGDPAGDDDGNGQLVYPQRQDFQRGDLDLVSLRIVRADDSYRFEATFRNPIRNPASVAGDAGPESLAYFARRGFYAFNLDIYIDQDRIRGSGNTYTLPGRRVSIDESHAWEKAIILTPRPELMRQQLIDTLAESERASRPDEVAKRIDRLILFPVEVQVRHRTVSFIVPAAFLAGGRPDTDWSITAFVTGAKTSIEADFNSSETPGAALARLPLGVMQPKSGRPRDTFGYTGASAPPPVVDVLAVSSAGQVAQLSQGGELAGVSWAGGVATKPDGSARPVTSLTVAPTAPVPPRNTDATVRGDMAERLRTLNELRAQGLVSEEEYQALRRRILSEL